MGVNQYNESKDNARRESIRNDIKNMAANAGMSYDQLMQQVKDYYTERGSLGNSDDVNTYKSLLKQGMSTDLTDENGNKISSKYSGFDGKVEDYLNPYYDQIIGDTTNQLQHTAAGAGLGRSSGAARAIATGVAQKENELYQTALQQYNTERDFDYKTFSDYIDNMQQRLNAKNNNYATQLAGYANLANDYYNTKDASMQAQLGIQQDKLSSNNQYAAALAGLT